MRAALCVVVYSSLALVLSQPPIPLVAQTPLGQPFNFNGSSVINNGLCSVEGADFAYTEVVDFAANTRTVYTTGCPNHFSACQFSNCAENVSLAVKRNLTITLPLYPQVAVVPKDLTCGIFDAGVALNGVIIRSVGEPRAVYTCVPPTRLILPTERGIYRPNTTRVPSVLGLGTSKTCSLWGDHDAVKDCGNIVPEEGIYYDKCGGRVDEFGVYNYKVLPPCLLAQLDALRETDLVISRAESGLPDPGPDAKVVSRGLHSAQIGWAMDGFPVYGPLGPDGIQMMSCILAAADPVFCIDSCGGYMGEMRFVDSFVYRYYMTGVPATGRCSDSVLNSGSCNRNSDKCCISAVPALSFAPYAIACLVGCALDDPYCVPSSVSGTTAFYNPKPVGKDLAVYLGSSETTIAAVAAAPTVQGTSPVDIKLSTTLLDALQSQEELISSVAGQQWTLFRFLHNRSLAVHKFDTQSTTVSGSTGGQMLVSADSYQMSLDGSSANTATVLSNSSFVSHGVGVELLRPTDQDTFINDMYMHRESNTLYLTLQSSIQATQLSNTSEFTPVVTSYIEVTIYGYSLGSKRGDVLSVKLGDNTADSIYWTSSDEIHATFTRILNSSPNGAVLANYSALDVSITTVGGSMLGPHLQPLTVLRSNSGRPVIVSVDIHVQSLNPHAIFVASSGWMYFSNLAAGFSGLLRCRLDGSLPEPLYLSRERIYAVNVVPLEYLGLDMVFFADAAKGGLFFVAIPASTEMIYDFPRGPTPLVGTNVELFILAGLVEPTALAYEPISRSLYLTTREGALYEIDVSFVASLVPKTRQFPELMFLLGDNIPNPLVHASSVGGNTWIRAIDLALPGRSRITALSVLPKLQDVVKANCDLRYSRLDYTSAWGET